MLQRFVELGLAPRLRLIGAALVALGILVAAGAAAPPAGAAAGADDPLGEAMEARARVLGGGVAVADPAAALSANPARLALATGLAVEAHLAPLPEGGGLDAAGVAWPLGPGVLGGSLVRLGVGDIATFDADGIPTGTAGFGDVELAVGYAVALPSPIGKRSPGAGGSPFDVGVALRLRRQSFGALAATGVGVDVGATLRPRAALEIGLRARNLVAPALTLAGEPERLPRALALGAAFRRSLGGRPLLLAGEVAAGGGEEPLGFGVELPIAGRLLGRAGAHGGAPRFGVGLAAGFVSVDYGIETHDLALVHMVSITAHLGEGAAERVSEVRAAAAAERAALAQAARAEAVAETVENLRAQAHAASTPEEARAVWLALRANRPEDSEATLALQRIESERAVARRDSLAAHAATIESDMGRLEEAAAARERAGDLAGAAATWGQILNLDPAHRGAEAGLARVRARVGAAADSLALARRDLGTLEANLTAQADQLVRLGLMLEAIEAHEAGDEKRAQTVLASLLAAYPGDPALLALKARIAPESRLRDPQVKAEARRLYIEGMRLFNAGDYEGAIRFWEELAALDPANQAVRSNLDEARTRLNLGGAGEPSGGTR